MVAMVRRALHRLPPPVRRILKRLPGAGRLLRSTAGRPGGPNPKPGTLRPVVYLPTWLEWSVMRQRPQYLLSAFARAGHSVFFVDPREKAMRLMDGVNLVPTLSDVPGTHVLLYVHFAPLRDLFDRFESPAVVYDLLDDLSIYDADEKGMPEARRVRAHHPLLMESADAVIASSPVLLDRHRSERGDILLVENGVEVERFRVPQPRPPEIPPGTPVVGYHGAVARWFDLELFREVATANPQWRFAIVGPVAPEIRAAVERVGELANVLLIGEQPSDRIAAFVQAFDVGAIWFQVDTLTEAVSPLKMYEYLAAGIPVVATPLPACVSTPGVRVASSLSEFGTAISQALGEPGARSGDRQATAREASWDRRLAPLLQRFDALDLRNVPS